MICSIGMAALAAVSVFVALAAGMYAFLVRTGLRQVPPLSSLTARFIGRSHTVRRRTDSNRGQAQDRANRPLTVPTICCAPLPRCTLSGKSAAAAG